MTRSTHRAMVCLGTAALAIASAACSKSMLDSPTAPSAETSTSPTAATRTVSTGASIAGSVIATTATSLPGAKALTITLTVRVVGTSIEVAVMSPGYFELHDVPTGDIQLQFVGAGIDAVLPVEGVTALERIELDVAVGGSHAVIERTSRETADSRVDVTGRIAAIDKTSLQLDASRPAVAITSQTIIRRGSEFVSLTDLHIRDEVRVRGMRDGAAIRAESIDAAAYTTVRAIVANLAGSCPNLTFTFDGVAVETDSSTVFAGNACATLKHGDKRSVSGQKTDGGLLARYVSAAESVPTKSRDEEERPKEVTIVGFVSGLSGTCPALIFTVNGQAVRTSSSTTFSREAGCGDVKNSVSIGVAGTKGTDGRVLARYISVSRVEIKPEPKPESEIVITGTIHELAGACPSRKFLLEGKSATTTSATIFGGGTSCADLKSGETWGGAGTKNGDGVLVMRYMTRL